jgi:hypothetical protein
MVIHQIVRMNVLSGFNRLFGQADWLTVFHHCLPRLDRPNRNFMPRRDREF